MKSNEIKIKKPSKKKINEMDFIKNYVPRISSLIKKFGFKDVDEVAELSQKFVYEFITGNYLNIYDPEISQMSTFLYHFVFKRCLREFTLKKRSITTTAIQIGTFNDFSENVIQIEDKEQDFEHKIIETEIKAEFKAHLLVILKSLSGKKNMQLTLLYLIKGINRANISKKLNISEVAICQIVKKLRKMASVKNLIKIYYNLD